MINTHNIKQTDHAFPLFATAQKPDARKSGKARRLFVFVIGNPNRPPCRHQPTDQNQTQQPTLLYFYFANARKKMKF